MQRRSGYTSLWFLDFVSCMTCIALQFNDFRRNHGRRLLGCSGMQFQKKMDSEGAARQEKPVQIPIAVVARNRCVFGRGFAKIPAEGLATDPCRWFNLRTFPGKSLSLDSVLAVVTVSGRHFPKTCAVTSLMH